MTHKRGVEPKCSFCGKTHTEVMKLIAGPDVSICDECTVLCKEIVDEDRARRDRRHDPCFFLAPPDEAFADLYRNRLAPALMSAGLTMRELSDASAPADDINLWEAISACDVLIADMTGLHPWVVFGAGIAYAKPFLWWS